MGSKIRFSNKSFKDRLRLARTYKRNAKIKSEQLYFFEILTKIGLDSTLKQLLLILFVLVFLSIVYLPNLFYINNIVVKNSNSLEQNIISATQNYFDLNKFPPSKNIIFLNSNKLKTYLEKNLISIQKVNSIKKKYFHTIIIETEPRVEKFLVSSQTLETVVSNDGKIIETFHNQQYPDSLNSLIKIKTDSLENYEIGKELLSNEWVNTLDLLNKTLPPIVKSEIVFFEIQNLNFKEISANSKSGTKYFFNLNNQLEKNLERLKLLLQQNSDINDKNLTYIDMRYGEKAYVCKINSECSKNKENILNLNTQTNATSTK